MGLSMAERKAVSKQVAVRYRKAAKKDKAVILTELCALTGWHRDHARQALRAAAGARAGRPARSPSGGLRRGRAGAAAAGLGGARRSLWQTPGPSARAHRALENHGELALDLTTRAKLVAISAATIVRPDLPSARGLPARPLRPLPLRRPGAPWPPGPASPVGSAPPLAASPSTDGCAADRPCLLRVEGGAPRRSTRTSRVRQRTALPGHLDVRHNEQHRGRADPPS